MAYRYQSWSKLAWRARGFVKPCSFRMEKLGPEKTWQLVTPASLTVVLNDRWYIRLVASAMEGEEDVGEATVTVLVARTRMAMAPLALMAMGFWDGWRWYGTMVERFIWHSARWMKWAGNRRANPIIDFGIWCWRKATERTCPSIYKK